MRSFLASNLCRSLAAGLLVLAAAGCGESVQMPEGDPVKGAVTLKGKPLTGVTVTLQDGVKGVGTSCVVDDQGRFTSGGPLPPGQYKVAFSPTLTPFEPGAAGPPPAPPKLPATLPRKYQQLDTSDLIVEVKADGSEVQIQIPG